MAESGKQCHPIIEIRPFVIVPHSVIIVLDDFNERTQDLGEENDTDEHEDDSHDHLVDWNGEVVTIAYGGKSCESIVAGYNCLWAIIVWTIFPFKMLVVYPFALFGKTILILWRQKVQELLPL